MWIERDGLFANTEVTICMQFVGQFICKCLTRLMASYSSKKVVNTIVEVTRVPTSLATFKLSIFLWSKKVVQYYCCLFFTLWKELLKFWQCIFSLILMQNLADPRKILLTSQQDLANWIILWLWKGTIKSSQELKEQI